MKAIWSGSISFGLINIPVKIYSAAERNRIDLDMLDENDYSRIRYQRVNESTGEKVEWENIVKGYLPDDKDEYVVLDDEDFEKAESEKTNNIKITEFVDEKEIPTIFFEKPYYLEPESSSKRSYALLVKALNESGKVGVLTFVLRQREHLGIIKPKDDVLILNQIRFEADIRNTDELEVPEDDDIDDEEIEIATDLIEKYEKEFDISDYRDDYTKDLMEIIEAKADGKQPKKKKKTKEKEATKSDDLMKKLKQSLKEAS